MKILESFLSVVIYLLAATLAYPPGYCCHSCGRLNVG